MPKEVPLKIYKINNAGQGYLYDIGPSGAPHTEVSAEELYKAYSTDPIVRQSVDYEMNRRAKDEPLISQAYKNIISGNFGNLETPYATDPKTGNLTLKTALEQEQSLKAGVASGTQKEISPGQYVPTNPQQSPVPQGTPQGTQGQPNQPQPQGTAQQTGVAPMPVSTYTGNSIVDYLNSVGQNSSFSSRKALAQQMGITNYTGSATQNTQLLNNLRNQTGGTTKSPTAVSAPVSAPVSTGTPAITGEPTQVTPTGKTPTQNVIDIYRDVYRELGLTDIKSAFEKTLKDQQDLTNKMNDEIGKVNNDPWLSEGVRVTRVQNVQKKYEQRLDTLSNYAKLYDSEYQQGQEQARFLVGQIETDINKAIELAQKKQDALDGLKDTPDIREYNLAQEQGYKGSFLQWQKDNANLKAQASGSGAFSQAQINSTINQIAGAFDNEPIVKNFNVLNEGYQFALSLPNNTTNPADDQGLIYAFAKAMDPGSVVREGEYATVQKYSQSWIKSFGKGVEQAIAGTGFLSQEARKNIKKTIESKYNASKSNYENVYNSYQNRIQQAKMGGGNTLTDYSQAFTAPQQPAPSKFDYLQKDITIKGNNSYLPRSVWNTIKGADKDALLAEAKADGYPLLISD